MKAYYSSVEDLYKHALNRLIVVASRHVYNKDLALDAVHNAVAKSVEYFAKHPERKIQLEIVEWLVIKSCKKMNKYSPELAMGHPQGTVEEWLETELPNFNGQL